MADETARPRRFRPRTFRPARAAAVAASWALGAAAGVALGSWLTATGGAGAPGAAGIVPGTDLLFMPAATFVLVFVVHFGVHVVRAHIGSARERLAGAR